MKVHFKPAAALLRTWAINEALPLWADAGFDRLNGRFEERLTLRGEPIRNVPIRLMVQARQVFSYGVAARYGWYKGARDLVDIAYRSMIRDFHRRDGRDGWVFSINRDGTVADTTRDLYAHAFVLLGIASFVKAGGARDALALADETLAFIDAELGAAAGGYLDASPRPDALRRQNPHMHMLEGLLSLWSASGERRYLAKAEGIFDLFARRFFRADPGVLGEYFDDALLPAPGVTGEIVEPGHHYEWVWLLRWLERESGLKVERYADALYRHADAYGYDSTRLVMDELLRDGRPHKTSRRAWPMTEAIKANVAEAALGRIGAVEKAISLTDCLKHRFFGDVVRGGWMDRLDEHGRPATDFMPASTLYHVICAVEELDSAAR